MRDLPLPTLPFSDVAPPAATAWGSLRRPAPAAAAALEVAWARTEEDVRAAQRLRYDVFALEMGARLAPPFGTPRHHDADLFDPFCEHLLVRAPAQCERGSGPVVGTYRVLTPANARRVGSLYSETEFDLTRLRPLRARMVELGRSCVHADWRSGGVILALWAALGDFMQRNRLDTMVGCASISMCDGGHVAASLWRQLQASHLASIDTRVLPRLPLPVDNLDQSLEVEPPALIKGYLRCGAKVMGPPAWDPDFNTADLPLIMRTAELPARYKRHFMGA